MKNLVALLMVMTITLGLVACSSNSDSTADSSNETSDTGSITNQSVSTAAQEIADETADEVTSSGRPTEGNGKIGFSTLTLGSEFFSQLDTAVHERFEAAGYEVVTVSCEMNATTQVIDIENLITMDCEAIMLFVVDPEAITDVLLKAREAGIKVYPIAATFTNREAYDAILGTDQYATGTGAAEMASEWIDKTFPDAEDGSIEVAIIGNTASVDATKRTNGMKTLTEINSKAKIVEVYDLSGATDSNIKSQEYSEMMISEYPNLKCVLAYGVDAELGSNEVFMRENGLTRSEFGIFGVDTSQVAYQQIKLSATDEGLVRGTVNLGDDLGLDCYNTLIGEYNDLMNENGVINLPFTKVTLDNVDEFIQ